MKKLVSLSLLALILFSCNTTEKKEATTTGNDNMKPLFEQNLAIVKSNIEAFSNKNPDAIFANVADTVTYNSPVYGDTVKTKAHYIESLKYWMENWDSLHLVKPVYLSGVDPATNQPDGSVRYYGVWEGVHKATGTHTYVSIYEYFNFNADHKISALGQYFDVGGLMNAVQPKK